MYEGPKEDFTPDPSQFPDLHRRSTLTEDLEWLIERKGGQKTTVAAVRELIGENYLIVQSVEPIYGFDSPVSPPRMRVTVRTSDGDNSVACTRNGELGSDPRGGKEAPRRYGARAGTAPKPTSRARLHRAPGLPLGVLVEAP